jgi:SNF2 family DNA or RNA helicase
MELFPYQVEGAEWLAKNSRALLADEMGLGKTPQSVRACDIVGARKVVVICPASLRPTWEREFQRFGKTGIQPEIYSYDKAARGAAGNTFGIDVLICDEAQYLKERTSLRSKAVFGPNCDGAGGLIERARYVWLLSGTPAPNSPYELWPMLRACAPKLIQGKNDRPMSFWTFAERYCSVTETGFGTKIGPGRNLLELKDRITPFILRRRKADVLPDLPPLLVDTLALSGDQVKKALKDINISVEAQQVRAALETDGLAGLERIAPHVASLRRLIGVAKAPVLAQWINERMTNECSKLVVFAHHREVIDFLAHSLQQFGVVTLTGSSDEPKRKAAVHRFQTDDTIRIFIGQIQAAGTGLTLTAASELIFAESSWVPAENQQAMMRIHRIGQHHPCLVRFSALAQSLDEAIARVVSRKMSELAQVFG